MSFVEEPAEPTKADIIRQFNDGLKLIAQMRGQIDLLRAQLADRWDNHHNALACPYCNPDRELLTVDQIATLTKELAEARAALESEQLTNQDLSDSCVSLRTEADEWRKISFESQANWKAKAEALEGVLRQVRELREHADKLQLVVPFFAGELDRLLALHDPVKEQKP